MRLKRKLGNTDIKYKIICAGSGFDIGVGKDVKVCCEDKTYTAKMHSKTKGRIDGLSAFYADFSLEVGQEIGLEYIQGLNTICIYILSDSSLDNDIVPELTQTVVQEVAFEGRKIVENSIVSSSNIELRSTSSLGSNRVEYAQIQRNEKDRAFELGKKAEYAICSDPSNISLLKDNISLYIQAMNMVWYEDEYSFGVEKKIERHIDASDIFLGACERVASVEYQSGNYKESLKYCEYVCQIPKDRDDFSANIFFIDKINRKQRTSEFCPEIGCLFLMVMINEKMGDIQTAITVAEYGVKVGSVKCVEFLADYYGSFDDENNILKACYYLEHLEGMEDERIKEEIKLAKERVWECRSVDIENTMKAYSNNWLPEPENKDITWEQYSNLSTELMRGLKRGSKNKDVLFVPHMPGEMSEFEKMGYTSGVINLAAMWEFYQIKHGKVETKGLLKKKKIIHYDGDLFEGDFVDCCKYIWNRRYRR